MEVVACFGDVENTKSSPNLLLKTTSFSLRHVLHPLLFLSFINLQKIYDPPYILVTLFCYL